MKSHCVMLSEAKHLQYLLENDQMQILRFAQDDSPRDFLRSLPDFRLSTLDCSYGIDVT